MGSNGNTAAPRATCTTRPHGSRQDSSGGAFSLNEVSACEGGVAYMSRSDPIYNFHNFRFSITCFYEPSQEIPSCCRRGKVTIRHGTAYSLIHIQYDVHLVALPTSICFSDKNTKKITLGSTSRSTTVSCRTGFVLFSHNSSLRSNRNVHHPPIEY